MGLPLYTKVFCILFAFCSLLSSCKSGNNSLWINDKINVQTDFDIFESELMSLINDYRQGLSLQPLIHDSQLKELVQVHTNAIASGEISFGHLGFSQRCSEGKDLIGGGNLCAENVAMGQKTPQAIFSAWMSSSGHRANIEEKKLLIQESVISKALMALFTGLKYLLKGTRGTA